MATLKVAATQMACSSDKHENLANAERLVRAAADQGTQIILLQELFETLYFCQAEKAEFFQLDPAYDSKDHWQTVMRGHSAANLMPVVASNRIGTETIGESTITFYGSSFITDNKGQMVAVADRENEKLLVADLDLDAYAVERASWGLFRDRRPEKYGPLMTLDGEMMP